MPLKNKKARQAQAQHAADSKFFGSNLINGIEKNIIDDPDYVESCDNSDGSDSEDGWAVSLFDTQENSIPCVSDLEDEPAPGVNAGDKRKAEAAECVDTSDDKDEEGAEDAGQLHLLMIFGTKFFKGSIYSDFSCSLKLYLPTGEAGHYSYCTCYASSKHAFIHRCQQEHHLPEATQFEESCCRNRQIAQFLPTSCSN